MLSLLLLSVGQEQVMGGEGAAQSMNPRRCGSRGDFRDELP